MFPFASPLEFVQAAMSLCGVVILSWSLWDALRDVIVLQSAGVNGARLLLARGNLRTEVSKHLVVMVLVVGGITSILLPPPTSLDVSDPQVAPLLELAQNIDPRILQENQSQRLAAVVSRIVAMIVTIILVIDSVMARRIRQQFIRRVGDSARLSERGRRGEQGETGSRGPAGPAGAAGPAGVAGASGAPGSAGAPGAAGAPAQPAASRDIAQGQIDVIEKDVKEIRARQIDAIEADAKEIKQDVKDVKKDVEKIAE